MTGLVIAGFIFILLIPTVMLFHWMANGYCIHRWEEQEGFMKCRKCGRTEKLMCNHKWKPTDTYYSGATRDTKGAIDKWKQKTIIYTCEKCGETIKKVYD